MDKGCIIEQGSPHNLLNPELAMADYHKMQYLQPGENSTLYLNTWPTNNGEIQYISRSGLFANWVLNAGKEECRILAQKARNAAWQRMLENNEKKCIDTD